MRYSVDEVAPPLGQDSGVRPAYFDSQYGLVSLDDAIEFVRGLNEKYPNVNRMGLNIELKCAQQYKNDFGIDVMDRLYVQLKGHNLHTRSLASVDVPIIIQSYDEVAVRHFKQDLGDGNDFLPTTLLINWPILEH